MCIKIASAQRNNTAMLSRLRYLAYTLSFLAISFLALAAISPSALNAQNAEAKQSSGKISLELNDAKQNSLHCRLTFVIQNGSGQDIEQLVLETVLFNTKSQVEKIIRLNFGALPIEKTRVKQFDLKQKQCANIKRILVNDIITCKGTALSAPKCLKLVQPSTKTGIALIL